VPEITQVEEFILKPTLKAGEVVQLVKTAPLLFKVVGETLMDDPAVPLFPVAPA
jgi:hypothetical protein